MTWKKVRLGDLITESRIPSENPDPNKRITVRLKVLGVEKRGLENEIAGATKQFVRRAGQFIYGKQNFHKGAFGIIPKELDGFETSADLPAFDVSEKCIPEWIFYFFKQGGFYLELASMARGVATQRIHPEQIYNLEVPLPNLGTQKTILLKIKSIEEKSALLSSKLSLQLTQITNLNQTILQEAIQGKLVKQDPKDQPASDLLKCIKAEKEKLSKKGNPFPAIKPEEIPFDIPANWVWCRLGEICEIKGGKRVANGYQLLKNPTPHIYIRVTDMKYGSISDSDLHYLDENMFQAIKQYTIGKDDIYMTIVGATIGKCGIVPEKFHNMNLTENAAKISPIIVNKMFLYKCLDSQFCQAQFIDKTKQVAVQKMALNRFSSSLIPLPPLSEQKRIVTEIEKQLAKTKQLKEHIIANQQATEQLLKALLHQAFEVEEVEEV